MNYLPTLWMDNSSKKLIRNFLSRRENNPALIWSVCTLLICYLMSYLYWIYSPGIGEYLAASSNNVFQEKEYWRLFTSSFIHADMAHFLSNGLMLTIMGYFVSYHFGFFIYPVMGFISGIFINLFVISGFADFSYHSNNMTIVGASGVVHYLWGFWFVTYILIQSHIPFNRRLMKVMAVGIFILVPTELKANVSYLAHGLGIIFGALTGLVYYVVNKRKIKSFEVWETISDDFDAELAEEALYSTHH